MVEIGRVRVNAGNAPIEQKISACPPQADICAFEDEMGWSPANLRLALRAANNPMACAHRSSDLSDNGNLVCEIVPSDK
jgi:hypothetical protein